MLMPSETFKLQIKIFMKYLEIRYTKFFENPQNKLKNKNSNPEIPQDFFH